MIIGPDGLVAHANPRLCEMVGRSNAELVGRRSVDFFPPEVVRGWQLRSVESAGEEAEAVLSRMDGGATPVLVSAGPVVDSEGSRVVTVVDISDRKCVERRLQEQYDEVVRLSDTVLQQALDLKSYSQRLEEHIAERTAELKEANMDSILMLAVACEARDEETGAHVLRIKDYSEVLAREIGLGADETERIGYSAVLHDVGKIQVRDEILKKPGRLTDEERVEMQRHTIAGESILSKRPFFSQARVIARHHHENWDGSGYPDALAGEHIPLSARIVHVVDVFDALTNKRVYKAAWSVEDAVAEIRRCSGAMFDPHLVEAFLSLVRSGTVKAIIALRSEVEVGPEA